MDQSSELSWHSISVTVAPEAAEAVEYAFNCLEALGTEINHLQRKDSDAVTIVGYFNHLPDEEPVRDELHYALGVYGFDEEAVQALERSEIANADWLVEWKKHWKPSTVGSFVISPPWIDVDDEQKIVIRIEPNMAFGTGTHETTQLCLRAIEKHYVPGDSFFDVGTGTGILAIGAARINLTSEISNLKLSACDTDVDSVSLAKENAELNGVGELIDFYIGSIDEETNAFDFVCANLTLDVILPMLPLLVSKARKTLLLSGILVEQEREIVSALADLGISDPTIEHAGEWLSVVISY